MLYFTAWCICRLRSKESSNNKNATMKNSTILCNFAYKIRSFVAFFVTTAMMSLYVRL